MDGLSLLVAHCVGDYLLQNDWMATNKKRCSFVCAFHSATYLIPFVALAYRLQTWQLVLILVQHFAQDRTGFVLWFMTHTGQEKFASPPMAPWSIFVVDNTFHLLWIVIVVNFIPMVV